MSDVNLVSSSESFIIYLHKYNLVSYKDIKGSKVEV
jgi:hypothetical protein